MDDLAKDIHNYLLEISTEFPFSRFENIVILLIADASALAVSILSVILLLPRTYI